VCRQSVLDLRANAARIETIEYTVEATGQWRWRIELDRVPVAVSSRSYLRARECTYNLQRFLEAVPQADIVAGARVVRSGRQRATVQVPDPSRADGPAGYLRAAPRPTVAPQPAPSRRVVPDAG
jgi:hypothetical protein